MYYVLRIIKKEISDVLKSRDFIIASSFPVYPKTELDKVDDVISQLEASLEVINSINNKSLKNYKEISDYYMSSFKYKEFADKNNISFEHFKEILPKYSNKKRRVKKNNTMSLDELKQVVDSHFNVDISTKTGKKRFIYARWVFFDLALCLGFSSEDAASKLPVKRDALFKGINNLDTMNPYSIFLYNEISKKVGLKIPAISKKNSFRML